jgi:hypothetical protein
LAGLGDAGGDDLAADDVLVRVKYRTAGYRTRSGVRAGFAASGAVVSI